MGCARPGLFPLLLLSKLVSKLDVLPGQFEVASPPPHPQSCQHTGGQAPRRAWGTGGKGLGLLSSTIEGLREARMTPTPTPTQPDPGLGKSLGWGLEASVPGPRGAQGKWPGNRGSAHF